MKKTAKNAQITVNCICCVLALFLIVLQFIPFWGCYQCDTCGDGKIISINEYIWFANDHKTGLTSILKNYYIPDFAAMDVVGASVFIQLAGIAGIVFCILKPTKLITPLLTLIAGLACTVGYLSQPAYQMGQMWQLHLAIGIVLTVLSAGVFLIKFIGIYRKAKAEIEAEAN